MADKKSVLLGFGDVSKVMMLKEECTAAGTAKVVPSATEDLRPKVGECVSDRWVVSGSPICSLSGMTGEALLRSRRSLQWESLGCCHGHGGSGARRALNKQCEKIGGLCRCEGSRSADNGRVSDAGLELPSGGHVFQLKGTTEGVWCGLCVCLWSVYLQHIGSSILVSRLSLKHK